MSTDLTRCLGTATLLALLTSCGDPVRDEQIEALGEEQPEFPPSAIHRPGQPCVLCHSQYGGAEPEMSMGGTLFFKPAKRVCRKHFCPFITVITCSVSPRKNVGKRMLKPIERRGLNDCYIATHLIQHILDRLSVFVLKFGVQPKIKYRKLQLADHLQARLKISRFSQFLQ